MKKRSRSQLFDESIYSALVNSSHEIKPASEQLDLSPSARDHQEATPRTMNKSSVHSVQPLARNCYPTYEYVTGPIGPEGDWGAPPNDSPILASADGTDGVIDIRRGTISEIAEFASNSYLNSLMRDAEFEYLSSARALALDRFIWIYVLLDAILTDQQSARLAAIRKRNRISMESLKDRATLFIRQISAGLDYFGEPDSYVPRLSFDFYKDRIERIRPIAESIESSLTQYKTAGNDTNKAIASLRAAATSVKAQQVLARKEVAEYEARFSALQARIIALRSDLDAAWLELFTASDDFKKAVERTAKCEFEKTLTFVACVATVISTGGAAIGAVAGAISSLGSPKDKDGKPTEDTIEAIKHIGRTVEPAGKSLNDFKKAYSDYGKSLGDGDANKDPAPPSDQLKFLVEKKDFDAAIRPFLNLKEAQHYKTVADRFVAIVETRNNLIIELDSTAQNRDKTETRIRQAEAEVDSILANLAALVDPSNVSFVDFLEQATQNVKLEIAKDTYYMSKAYGYFALKKPPEIVVKDFALSALLGTYAQVDGLYAEEKEKFSQDAQRFTDKSVSVFEFCTEQTIRDFWSDGVLTFSIPYSHPSFSVFSHVKIDKCFVVPKFRSGRHEYRAVLMHHGQGVMRDREGRYWMHTHREVVAATERNKTGQFESDGSLIDSKGWYEGVSPFATWSLRLYVKDKKALKRLSDVQIVFSGYARAVFIDPAPLN